VAASGRYCSRFCIARPAEVEWQHPVATAHGSALRALRRWSARSGRYRSRFCIGRPAEVKSSIRSLPLTVLYWAPRGGEVLDPVATAHGSALRALPRLSGSVWSLLLTVL
jgi:hypothetical protein